jgi:hypothetical protein
MNYQKKVPIYRDAVCLVVEIDSENYQVGVLF